ncbi:MAG: DUF4349 domain-containing protein [Terriglobia bacterium]
MPEHLVQAEELQAYLDRELALARQEEVERHAVECQECSAMIADLKRVSATLQQWQVDPAPATLRPPVIPTAEKKAGFRWGRLALGLSGAAVVFLLLVAISIPNLLRSPMASKQASDYARQRAAMGTDQGMPEPAGEEAKAPSLPATTGRFITYQVTMTVEVKEFDSAKDRLRQIVDAEGGYTAQANFVETPDQPRRANLVLRVPTARLATILNQVRALGRVKEEHLSSEEVTEQVVDLEARLHNARATEQRLIAVLNTRAGRVTDILEVEREIARTRQEIERMEAQRQNLLRRVELATVTLTLAEELKAQLGRAPFATVARLRNAFIDGYSNFVDSVLGLTVFLVSYGPTLLLWGALIWLAWLGGRRLFRRMAKPGA